jgi:hypothetical protein
MPADHYPSASEPSPANKPALTPRRLAPDSTRHGFARVQDRFGLASLIIFLAISSAFFGRSLAAGFTAAHLGRGPDPSFLMWALAWWPYAIAHRLNPFLCRIVWAPSGFNLAWSGSIPLAALAAAPVTANYGPVAAYNLMALITPALAAWCAFLLCRYVTSRWCPAIIGGYVFGFSSYMLGQMVGGHLNLLFVFPAPMIVMLTMMRFDGKLRVSSFAVLIALAFAAQFMLSIELAATAAFFGAIALVLSYAFVTAEGRLRLLGLAIPIAFAIALLLALTSPYLYYLLARGVPHGAINSPAAYSTDLLNFILPTRTVSLGAVSPLRAITDRFPGNLGEAGGYLGLPLLAIIVLHARKHWSDPAIRTVAATLAVICLFALGPRIHIAGWIGFGMPSKALTYLPLIKSALPARFMSYASLAAALVTARWLADEAAGPRLHAILALALIALSIPNLNPGFFSAPVATPAFLTTGAYRIFLRPGETVIALPYGITGETMLWQAEAAMYFRMASGYTGITPREFESWPIAGAFSTQTLIPDAPAQLRAFMAAHEADTVIVDDRHLALWRPLLSTIDQSPVRVGGVSIYRATSADLAAYRGATALAMEQRVAAARFAALIAAAQKYLAQGCDPAALTPMRAQQLGLLPPNSVRDPDVRTNNGLYLGPWKDAQRKDEMIAAGIVGSYDAIAPIVAKYRSNATRVLFPYPKELTGFPRGDNFMRLLVIVFDRAALSRAAGPNP